MDAIALDNTDSVLDSLAFPKAAVCQPYESAAEQSIFYIGQSASAPNVILRLSFEETSSTASSFEIHNIEEPFEFDAIELPEMKTAAYLRLKIRGYSKLEAPSI